MPPSTTPNRREFLQYLGTGIAVATGSSFIPSSFSSVSPAGLPFVPYGAVYFRKTNPPKRDWARDYRQAAADGMNCFRHWFMWSAIEVAPGKYDWDDYDQQLDLAAKNGISTIVGIIMDLAPQWAFRQFPHARVGAVQDSKVQERLSVQPGSRAHSHYTGATAVGGWPGLCFDNEDVLKRGDEFLTLLVERYRDHPAMGGYDVWNELNQYGDFGACHCEASAQKFREWLQRKYTDLSALGEAWYRYSYADWKDVQIPMTVDPYPDSIDWYLFRVDNAVRLLKHRIELIKKLDTKNAITTHAIPLGTLKDIGPETYPLFQAGQLVDIHGYSGGSNHEAGSHLRWMHWAKMDLVRSASNGKPFWAAEMPAGASWRMKGTEMDKGRLVNASDVILYSLMQLAGGARGIFSPRWRPLQDGKNVGMFGFYDMDGSPTERSEAGGKMARWANDPKNADLLRAQPVKSDIGILVVPESQIHNYVSTGKSTYYYRSVTGAYQAFLFNNIQVDFVHIDFFDPATEILYLPYPLMLSKATAEKLIKWVDDGGYLISEGCPAYFGDLGRAGTRQPHYGMDELFGVRQSFVQFTPDLLEQLEFQMNDGLVVQGGLYLQAYEVTSGEAVGKFPDGRIAVVDHSFGRGRTRLIGTFPGYGYLEGRRPANRTFFRSLLSWAGKQPQVMTSDERIIARLQTGGKNRYLWVVNVTREAIPLTVTLDKSREPITDSQALWGVGAKVLPTHQLQITMPAREASVLEIS